jgi:hypothetical protein
VGKFFVLRSVLWLRLVGLGLGLMGERDWCGELGGYGRIWDGLGRLDWASSSSSSSLYY